MLGPDPVSYEGRSYRATPSEVNPKPVQAHVPILLGAAEDIEQEVGLMAELIGAARKST